MWFAGSVANGRSFLGHIPFIATTHLPTTTIINLKLFQINYLLNLDSNLKFKFKINLLNRHRFEHLKLKFNFKLLNS